MPESWKTIANRALSDYKFMDTLDNRDKQMLYAFHSFSPPLAVRKHLVIRATNTAIRLMMLAINEPGGVWHDPRRIPFDESGGVYVQNAFDHGLFPEHFRWWVTPKNQEMLYECGGVYDERGFTAIIPARTPPDVLRHIDQLDPSDYKGCQDAFLQWLPDLRWMMIFLRPTGDFGIFLASQNFDDLQRRIEHKLHSQQQVQFRLSKASDRFHWKGPTSWD